LIHTAGASSTNPWGGAQDPFLESMGEAAKSVSDSLGNGNNILYINVMNKLSVDCDCTSNPAEPDMHDIGILGSLDPVALDKACVDLIYAASDGQSLIRRIESRNGVHTLNYAENIGLGSQSYSLSNLDTNQPEAPEPGQQPETPPIVPAPSVPEESSTASSGCNSNTNLISVLALGIVLAGLMLYVENYRH
jgi:hypothetical protein